MGERILAGEMAGFIFILNLMDKGFLRVVIVAGGGGTPREDW